MEINYLVVWLNVVITLIIYMIVPVILRIVNGAYEFKDANRISMWNSISICLFFAIMKAAKDNVISINFMPALIYYCINSLLLSHTKKKKIKKNYINKKEKIDIKRSNQKVVKKQKSKEDKKNNIKAKPKLKKEKSINEVNIRPVIKAKKVKTKYCKNCGGKLNESKKCTKCGKQYFHINITKNILLIIVSIFLIISLVSNVYFILNNKDRNSVSKSEVKKLHNKINKLEEEIDSLEDDNWDLTQEKDEYEEKADFLDENIVFVIEGYGNYYYTYDCANKITSGEYTYWAYNEDLAIYSGYNRGTCN